MSKIKKSMGLKGSKEPTLDQLNYGLNLQDRMEQQKILREKQEKVDGTYIQPDTVEPKLKQKRLKSAVNSEARSVGNPNSNFIEHNKKNFMNVSNLNLRRAEQIRQQFNQQRRLVFEKLNKENPRKDVRNAHSSARNTSTYVGDGNLAAGGRARPYTAYGGIAAPPRNIKSIVRDQYVRSSVEQNGQLENILSDMNVISRGGASYPFLGQQNADLITEKFGAKYVNINKTKVLNKWIKEEIVKFEERQDESLKNLDLQSKLNESSAHHVDS